MNPSKDQLIQIRFNNGVFFDAIVESWSDQKSVVKLITTGEIVVIQKTLQDVLMIKIIDNKPIQPSYKLTDVPLPHITPNENNVDEGMDDVSNQISFLIAKPMTPSAIEELSNLKNKSNKIERKEKLTTLNEFKPNGVREINYGIPRYIPISGSPQHTNKKVASTDPGFNTELQNLFNKEH